MEMNQQPNQNLENASVQNQEENTPKTVTPSTESQTPEKENTKEISSQETQPNVALPEEPPTKEDTAYLFHENAEENDLIEDEISAHETEKEVDYSGYNREELVKLLEETVANEDVNAIKNKVSQIKVAYLALTGKEKHEKYSKQAAAETEEDKEIAEEEVTDVIEERYKAAFNTYKTNKLKYTEEQEKIKLQNLDIKKSILEELKTLIASEETLKKTYDEFKVLQDRWKEIGMVPKNEAQALWQNYHFLIEKFFDKVKINKELKDLDLKKNLERKIELCEKAEDLVIEPSITKSFKRLQELHEEWKEIGPVIQEKRDEIWERFKLATEKINDRRHQFYKKLQSELEANQAAKTLLCENAEQLVATECETIKQWQDTTEQINNLLTEWKAVGQAPQKVNNDLWSRFKSQLDLFFANKKEYFGKIKDQQLNNYNLKVELCLQAEAIKNSTEWKNTTRELIRLQEEWKKIGPVPRKYSDKVWKRFRAACDEFFNSKSEFFKTMSEGEEENLQRKLELISKLENFEYGEDKQANIDKIKDIQREWMEIGHVPIKEKDKLQNDYRNAVNKIYDKLKVDAMEASAMNYRSRLDSMKEMPDANRIINRERSSLQQKIDELKENILLWENNIGFFASSKQANVLKAEFEGKINKAKGELANLESKMKMLRNATRE